MTLPSLGEGAFIVGLREMIRDHLLGKMPDPSGELAQRDLQELLVIYGNWRGRYMAVRPRQVHESRELQASSKRSKHIPALHAIRTEIETGQDMMPRLSRRVRDAYVPEGERPHPPYRRDRDLLLADWGIYHLHLGTKKCKSGGDDVLLAYFTRHDAFLIDIRVHRDNWASVSLMKIVVRNWPGNGAVLEARSGIGLEDGTISDSDRLAYRQAGVTMPLEIDGKVYLPAAGQTCSGTPMAVTEHANVLMHRLRELDSRFTEDLRWLDGCFGCERQSLPEQPDWRPYVHEEQYGALEWQTHCFVPFGPLTP